MEFLKNKHNDFIIFVILTLILHSVSCDPKFYAYKEYKEEIKDLQYQSYDSNQDEVILLHFYQESNPLNIHLRIVFLNGTVIPIKVDYKFPPENYNITMSETYIKSNILNGEYVLVKFIEIDNGQRNNYGLILSWNKGIVDIIHLGTGLQLFSNAINSYDPNNGFVFIDFTQGRNIGWKKFSSPQAINSNQTKVILLASGETDQVAPISKANLRHFFSFIGFRLSNGGFGMVANNISTMMTDNGEVDMIEFYVRILGPNATELSKPYILNTAKHLNELFQNRINGCESKFDGTGYVCSIGEYSLTIHVNYNIHFLSNGAITSVNYTRNGINSFKPLFYGGYITYASGIITAYDDDFNVIYYYKTDLIQTGEYDLIQRQNILWNLNLYHSIQDTWNVNKWDVTYYSLNTIDSNDIRFKYQNPNLKNTYPGINESVELPSQIIINYNIPVTLSTGNLTIYQYDENGNIILRQSNFGQDIRYVQMIDNTTISVKALPSTFHKINAKFGIRVDNDFVKSQVTQEPLLGISERIWTFTTYLKEKEKPADQLTLSIQLKFDNNHYNEIISTNNLSVNMHDELKKELSKIIPLNPSRLNINKKVQYVNTASEDEKKVILSITILPPENKNGIERNTESVKNDLDELIREKNVNLIIIPQENDNINSIARFLDENYGAQPIPYFWERYYVSLIILVVSILILGAIIFLAKRKCPEGKNFSIIKIVLIIYDLIFDIAFLLTSASDIKYLFKLSLLSIIVPIFLNMVMALYTLTQEISHNKEFNEWSKENGLIISAFTVLSCADIEALNILSSKIAGLKVFSAPLLSERSTKLIFWIGFTNTFMEDIPQFLIQVYYQKSIIVFTIIPTISLITSFATLCVGIVGKIYLIYMHKYNTN